MTATAETRTRYDRPYRPLPVAAYNRLMGFASSDRIFEPDRLLASARKTAGETTLSDAPLMKPLEHLCAAIRKEARLSPFGRIIQHTRIKTLIVNRLRLDAIMRTRPEILEAPIPPVIVIAGLARTGTTLLHRVLAADPDARTLPSWEALNPAPVPGEAEHENTQRLKQARMAGRMMNYLAPDFAAVHPVSAEEPEEDLLLLDMTMMSQTAESVMNVPSYSAWLERQDHRPAYAYFQKVLKVLNHFRPGRHWVLKSPHHAEQLDIVFETFDDLTVVQTHRDPLRTMPSCCSLMAHAQSLSTDDVDPDAIGRHWLRKSQIMAENAMAAREANHDRPGLDIYYKDLLANPQPALEAIYSRLGRTVPDDVTAAARQATQRGATSTHKRHRYSPADFGLDEAQIMASLGRYAQHHRIPLEGGH